MSSASIPLARLFVMGAGHLISRLHERLEADGWGTIRPAYGFVLSRLRDEPARVTDLAEFLGITKQAGSKLIDRMEDLGLVETGPHPDDSRAKTVTITAKGSRLLTMAEDIYTELEAEWADIIGREGVESMRENLTTVLRATNEGELPPMRPV